MASAASSSGRGVWPSLSGTTVHLDTIWRTMLYSECPGRTDPGR